MPTSPPTPTLSGRLQRLLRASLLVWVALLSGLSAGGCLSNPTPHPGIDDDLDPATGFENDGEVRGGDNAADTETPPGETDALADVCGPLGGDVYGDVGRDACGAGDTSDPSAPDVCGSGGADVDGDTSVGPTCAPDAREGAGAGEFEDDDVGPLPAAEAP